MCEMQSITCTLCLQFVQGTRQLFGEDLKRLQFKQDVHYLFLVTSVRTPLGQKGQSSPLDRLLVCLQPCALMIVVTHRYP
jgi:hypothetical protein